MIPGSRGHGLPPHLPHDRGSGPDFCNSHLLGMFLPFFLSERLLVYVIVRIRASLAQRDVELEALQHQLIEEDQLVRLGLLSSGTALDLGTPLTTLAVTLAEAARRRSRYGSLCQKPPDQQRFWRLNLTLC